MYLPTKKPSASTSRGQEILVVPPQFTPQRGLTGSRQIRRLYRALPVLPYLVFRQAAPKGIPSSDPDCLAPAGSSLAESLKMYWFSSTRYRYVMLSLPLRSIEVNTKKVRKYTITPAHFCAFCQPLENRCFSPKYLSAGCKFFLVCYNTAIQRR